jgi:hypothetical protein
MTESTASKCELCGEPMPPGEEMFKFHGYSSQCPKPPLPRLAKKLAIVAGIAIDRWKLPIFCRHLTIAGYDYSTHPGVTADTMLLKVECDSVEALEPVARAANAAAALEKP